MNKGKFGENHAAEHLLAHGYEIVERNFRSPYGEIDIIARDGTYIVFVEVKARGSSAYGFPREAVDRHKQRRIVNAALCYLQTHPIQRQPRFDVMEVLTDKRFSRVLDIHHIPHAFDANVNY